jgi:sigma-B regulation protein RsbU (phosphoserine phosphatase)
VALEDYARLSADQVRQAVVQYELSRAWEIQSKLLPTVLEGWPGALELAVHFRPARETSGDFYDVLTLPLPDAGLAAGELPSPPPLAPLQIAVADVAGKGIAAALVMALARATLRTIADSALGTSNGQVPSPATTMSLAGRRLHRDVGQRDFVCCALAVVEPPRSRAAGPRMRLANGGQVPPILCRGGEAQELEPAGERFPLGVLSDPEYGELVVDLAPGDVVVFASDGLPEAPARPGLLDVAPSVGEPPNAPLAPPSAAGDLFGFERLAASAVYWTARSVPGRAAVWPTVMADDGR